MVSAVATTPRTDALAACQILCSGSSRTSPCPRGRRIGRTIAYICLDLGIIPSFCAGEFGNEIFEALYRQGGSFMSLRTVRTQREKTYKRERDQHPDTWIWDWRDLSKPRVRQVMGYLIGDDPPDPLAA